MTTKTTPSLPFTNPNLHSENTSTNNGARQVETPANTSSTNPRETIDADGVVTLRLPRVKHAYSGKARHEHALVTTQPSMTKQEFKDESDINVILARYQKTGLLINVNHNQAVYGDTTAQDFQEAMNVVAAAQSAFDDLPAHLRDRFQNDPAQLLDFVHNEDNRAEAEELGLVPKSAPKTENQPITTIPAQPAVPVTESTAKPA